LDFVVKLPFIL